jgi:predicted SnoaL-like aldol condensation-catalyzing enzyme
MEAVQTRKEAAVSFLRMAAAGRAQEAFERFAAPRFVHHNPFFADDARSLATAMDENARKNPDKKLTVLRAICEGDLVAVHSEVHHAKGDRGAAVVHIFRFDGDKLAELWDLGQEVPADSPNTSGMF